MATFASAQVGNVVDGTLYSTNVPLTAAVAGTDADLNNALPKSQGSPPAVRYGEAILAVVTFTVTGPFATDASYVILQTSVDGGATWVDVAGVVCTATSGVATFVIGAGVAGAIAQQQTRAAGSAPAANFANQMPLGGVFRFVGALKTTAGSSSSSSSSSGSPPAGVTATIVFKVLGLR